MATICKRMMFRHEKRSRNRYGQYTSIMSRPATKAEMSNKTEYNRAFLYVDNGGRLGLHLCGGQITADVQLSLEMYDDSPCLDIVYHCAKCGKEADKESVGIQHWPDNNHDLETWLNQLLRDR